MSEQPVNRKSLVTASDGAEPAFEPVANAAEAALLCDLTVQVLCLTEEHLERWRRRVPVVPSARTKLHVHDLNRSTLAEWRRVLAQRPADLTVLAGFHSAQRHSEMAPSYVNAVVEAIPSGMVVMA